MRYCEKTIHQIELTKEEVVVFDSAIRKLNSLQSKSGTLSEDEQILIDDIYNITQDILHP